MSEVIFIKQNFLENLKKAVRTKKFSFGEKIGIKVHMGEYGNLTHVRPQIVGAVVEELKSTGATPFLFDTPTAYFGSRATPEKYLETARKNGFTKEVIGCPIIISDEGIMLKGEKYLEEVEVAKYLYESDALIVISHFKGHPDAGFGGAIKNLGMGGVTKRMKEIEHEKSQPKIVGDCLGCGKCVDACKNGAIKIVENKVKINYERCFGCAACVEACPNNVLKPKKALLRVLLAEASAVILKKIRRKKLLFINVLFDITKGCDCFSTKNADAGRIICPNIGILVSDDIVAVEKASLDLVIKAVGKNIFNVISNVKSEEQINAAESFNLGSKNYTLKILE